MSHLCRTRVAPGHVFLLVLPFYPCNIPPMLHTRLKLNIALIRRTSGRSLGTFTDNALWSRKPGSIEQARTLTLFCSGFGRLISVRSWRHHNNSHGRNSPPPFIMLFRFSLQGTSLQDDPTVTATSRTSNGDGIVAIWQIVCDIHPPNTVHLIFNGRLQSVSWPVDWAWWTNRKTSAMSRSNSMSCHVMSYRSAQNRKPLIKYKGTFWVEHKIRGNSFAVHINLLVTSVRDMTLTEVYGP